MRAPAPASNHRRNKNSSHGAGFYALVSFATVPAAIAVINICKDLHLPFDTHQFEDEVRLLPGAKMPTAEPEEPRDDLSFISGVPPTLIPAVG